MCLGVMVCIIQLHGASLYFFVCFNQLNLFFCNGKILLWWFHWIFHNCPIPMQMCNWENSPPDGLEGVSTKKGWGKKLFEIWSFFSTGCAPDEGHWRFKYNHVTQDIRKSQLSPNYTKEKRGKEISVCLAFGYLHQAY